MKRLTALETDTHFHVLTFKKSVVWVGNRGPVFRIKKDARYFRNTLKIRVKTFKLSVWPHVKDIG